MITSPPVPIAGYRDSFGNWCSRIVAPAGADRDPLRRGRARQRRARPRDAARAADAGGALPEETLLFLLGSRYCETDLLIETAWSAVRHTPAGWRRVQAICDFVHQHITFGYEHASATKTAFEVHNERRGVCRDFAHLAITLCRCMNIPGALLHRLSRRHRRARCRRADGLRGLVRGLPRRAWHTFDPRNNTPRIGRILIARGRDAADVAISTTFGPNRLDELQGVDRRDPRLNARVTTRYCWLCATETTASIFSPPPPTRVPRIGQALKEAAVDRKLDVVLALLSGCWRRQSCASGRRSRLPPRRGSPPARLSSTGNRRHSARARRGAGSRR